jgi:hypothetical protein
MLWFLKSRKLREGNMAQGTSFNMEAEFAGLDIHSLRLEERFIRPPGVKTIWLGLMKLYILLAYREYLA